MTYFLTGIPFEGFDRQFDGIIETKSILNAVFSINYF